MRGNQKVTIYDIAKLANTSASTVSAVLNGTWQSRRISATLAETIRETAERSGYVQNMQAKALRERRSGLIGMIIPLHDNRYFSAISQAFEREARAQGLWPIVVSTLRDPQMEIETAKKLISYRVEALVITGASDPDAVGQVCRAARVRHINVDLPGSIAPSVIGDNRWGATELTIAVLDDLAAKKIEHPVVHFIGGVAKDNSTSMRISGFRHAMARRGQTINDDQIEATGYAPELAEASIRALYDRLGRLPDGLIINSTIAFEGIVRFFRTLPRHTLHSIVVGCYDWDPFAALVEFPLTMVRQDVDTMVTRAFHVLNDTKVVAGQIELIRPELVRAMGSPH